MAMAKADLRQFDYKKTGRLDSEMWRAYYNHQFIKLFRQLLKLIRSQLGLNWLVTLRLAYYSAWAAADYRINRKSVNKKRVLNNLCKYYKLISKHSVEQFDYKKAAELELKWWDVHRASYENSQELENSLAEAAAVIYNVQPTTLKDYAHYRAEAMLLPRHQGDSDKNIINWPKIEELTIKSWQSLHTAVQN
jgi:hypothetical protein